MLFWVGQVPPSYPNYWSLEKRKACYVSSLISANFLWLEIISPWWLSLINAFTIIFRKGLTGVMEGDRDFQDKSSEWDPLEEPNTIHCFKMFGVNNQTQSFISHTPCTIVKLVHMDSFLQMISATLLLVNDPKCLCKCKVEHLTMLFCSN